tara:strand:+ start:90 stop:245 length:156 start_codon:yes stop_codon:yes gene_type:complete
MSENATIYSPNLNSKKIRPDKDLPKDNNKIANTSINFELISLSLFIIIYLI